jgi:hypothetical protein
MYPDVWGGPGSYLAYTSYMDEVDLVLDFKGFSEMANLKVLPNNASMDEQVEQAFKLRMVRGLDENEDGASFLNLMNSYILWKYREEWREVEGSD